MTPTQSPLSRDCLQSSFMANIVDWQLHPSRYADNRALDRDHCHSLVHYGSVEKLWSNRQFTYRSVVILSEESPRGIFVDWWDPRIFQIFRRCSVFKPSVCRPCELHFRIILTPFTECHPCELHFWIILTLFTERSSRRVAFFWVNRYWLFFCDRLTQEI